MLNSRFDTDYWWPSWMKTPHIQVKALATWVCSYTLGRLGFLPERFVGITFCIFYFFLTDCIMETLVSIDKINGSALAFTNNVSNLELYEILNPWLPDVLFNEIPTVYFTLGLTLNLILVLYIIRSGKWQSPTFIVVSSVALADVLTCASAVVWGAYIYPTIDPHLGWLCHLSMFTGLGGASTSGYNLVFFAGLRFYQLTSPLKARARVTLSFTLKGCAIVWFLSQCVYGTIKGSLYNLKQVMLDGEEVTICEQLGNNHAANIGCLLLNTTTPSVTITILHLSKYFKVSKAQKNVETSQERLNADARAVSIVIIVYVICWFPVNLYSVSRGFLIPNYHMFQDKLYILFIWFLCCNSTLNPIIYCIAAKSIRQDLIRVLLCRKSAK